MAIYYNINSKSWKFFSVKKKSFLSMNHSPQGGQLIRSQFHRSVFFMLVLQKNLFGHDITHLLENRPRQSRRRFLQNENGCPFGSLLSLFLYRIFLNFHLGIFFASRKPKIRGALLNAAAVLPYCSPK